MSEVKLTIGIPTAGRVPMDFAYSLAGLIGYIGAHGSKMRPETAISVQLDVQTSSVIHTNREMIVHRAIEKGQTHLLFLDDDMRFEANVLDVLLGRRHPVVVTNYMIKTEPASEADWVAVGLDGKRVPTTARDTGIVPIAASGFGVSLFDLEVFKKTTAPWFLPYYAGPPTFYSTEDYPCYGRMREAGYEVMLDQDASKLVSHCGAKVWNWQEWKGPKAEVVEISTAQKGVA